MPIYTKTGDKGYTSIIGGKRLLKSDIRIQSYGALDELTAFEGDLYNRIRESDAAEYLLWVINRTMDCAAIIASDGSSRKKLPAITSETVGRIEQYIDSLQKDVPQVCNFTLPVGCDALSASHICRTVCRRAERLVVELSCTETVDQQVMCFINRMSDFFYALGRYIVHTEDVKEILWTPDK